MSKRPQIGITFDSEDAGGYSNFPWYALRQNYCDAVVAAGGLPIPLSHDPALVPQWLDTLQGLVISGGAFDVDPALFGETTRHETVKVNFRRTAFEMAMVRGALDRNLPILGICGGEQLLNVALGGTLIQHIPDSVDDPLPHEQPNPRDQAGHSVSLVDNTLLYKILGTGQIMVNSAHHQAVRQPAPGCVVNAWAGDGVIEGIESPAHRFCIGVQWHPEFHITDADKTLFNAFVEASRHG